MAPTPSQAPSPDGNTTLGDEYEQHHCTLMENMTKQSTGTLRWHAELCCYLIIIEVDIKKDMDIFSWCAVSNYKLTLINFSLIFRLILLSVWHCLQVYKISVPFWHPLCLVNVFSLQVLRWWQTTVWDWVPKGSKNFRLWNMPSTAMLLTILPSIHVMLGLGTNIDLN